MITMGTKAFENVKNQIGYCAIWCGSCVVGNGALKALTGKYEHIIESYGVDKWGAEDQEFNGADFMKTLQAIRKIPVCPGCLKGGGATNCKIRTCASGKNLSDCTQCKQFLSCEHREGLMKVRSGALKAGMLVKMTEEESERPQLIAKWMSELQRRFPACLILSDHGCS
jgi:hypothetical protein